LFWTESWHGASGSRYTIRCGLTTDTIIAINIIGARWSQLQWLVAALGVGTGFGPREIPANLISGRCA